MKRQLTCLILALLLILSLPAIGLAQLEAVFPFANKQIENYYIKIKAMNNIPDTNIGITEAYHKDNTTVTQFEIQGQLLQYKMEETETWTPDLDLSLFFSNYEIKVIDTQQVADRTCLVIKQYRKHDNQLVIKYVIDKETGLTLNQYRYDPQGNLYLAFETLAIDYEPDFSAIDFDSIPDYTVSIQQHPLSQTDFYRLVPWINLTSLPLPEGFQIIGYSQVDYPKEIQQNLYLTEKYPNTPITHLRIWLSDGYYISTIEVSFATTQAVNINENSEIKIVENTTDSTTAVILEQPIAIEIIGEHSTSDQHERAEILKALFMP